MLGLKSRLKDFSNLTNFLSCRFHNAHTAWFIQVQATVRSHLARWKDGRHFRQTTGVSIFVSAGHAAADILVEGGDIEMVVPTVAHRSTAGIHQQQRNDDREQPATQLSLLPLHTAVDIDSYENVTF